MGSMSITTSTCQLKKQTTRKTGCLSVCVALGILFAPLAAHAGDVLPQNPDTDLSTVLLNEQKPLSVTLYAQSYPIDLATILKLVETQNLTIAQSQKNTEVLKSRYRQKMAANLPNIEGSYNQSRLEGAQQVFGDVVTVVRKTVQPQLTATWTLYPGGQTIFDMLAARRRKMSADDTLTSTLQAQLSLATQEYYKLLAAYQQKNVYLNSLAQAEEQISTNQAKVDSGKGIPLDLSRSKTNYSQQKTSLVQAENAVIQAEQTLLNRLNLDNDIHLIPPAEVTEFKTVDDMRRAQKTLIPATAEITKLLDVAVEQNPSILSGQDELKALGFDYKTVRSQLIPSVTLRAYVARTGPDWDNQYKTQFGGLTANMNILQNMGLMIPFQMQERKKLIEQKMLAQKQLVRDIETRVMTARLNSDNYLSVIDSARQGVASAEESYDLALGRYNSGYGINVDVLTAQADLVTAKNNLIQAVLNYNQSQVQLVEALGLLSSTAVLDGVKPDAIAQAVPKK